MAEYYQVKDFQVLEGQEILNVWYFTTADAGATAEKLANAYASTFQVSMKSIQVANLIHQKVEVVNLNDPQIDFFVLPQSTAGTLTGDRQARWDAWAYRLNGTNRTTRAGAKRIAGVDETWTVGSTPTAAATTALDGVATAFDQSIQDIDGNDYSLVIVRYSGTQSLGYTIDAANPVASVEFVGLTTQNTRKR